MGFSLPPPPSVEIPRGPYVVSVREDTSGG